MINFVHFTKRVNVPPSIALDKNKSILCHYAIRALSAIHGTSISCVELMCLAPLRSSMMINICPSLGVISVAYSECISPPPLHTCVPDPIRAVTCRYVMMSKWAVTDSCASVSVCTLWKMNFDKLRHNACACDRGQYSKLEVRPFRSLYETSELTFSASLVLSGLSWF